MSELPPNIGKTACWPSLMRPRTLKAYLDCRSDSDFSRKLKVLAERGYPGIDPDLHRHHKVLVDQFLDLEKAGRAERKASMLRAARGKA
jgi:hypothetical protein